jgi:deoxycytidine triphosphate deaminase
MLMATGHTGLSFPSFPPNDDEAQARYEAYRHVDPFPDVAPALLNSADLLDYIATVGMLSPYEVKKGQEDDWLKPASCAVACTGNVLRFATDPDGEAIKVLDHELQPDTYLELPPNSITYLQLGTVFRFPDYIAGRFNLAIREIHRGFLVGTGPLIDPGFVGRLFMPLHNLTANTYRIAVGEPIVWVEFTKLSTNEAWGRGKAQARFASFAPFPERKLKRKSTAAYLNHANEGRPIVSSIPSALAKAARIAERAADRVKRLEVAGVIGVIVTAITLIFAVVLPMIGLVADTNNRVDEVVSQRPASRAAVTRVADDRINAMTRALEARLAHQRREIDRLRARLTFVEATEGVAPLQLPAE